MRRVLVLPDADPVFEHALLCVLRLPGALTPEQFRALVEAERRT